MPIEMDVDVQDGASDALKWLVATKPDWMRKILKSVGWMVQKEIKKGIKSGAPGGQSYQGRMEPVIRSKLDEQGRGRRSENFPWMGDLQKAVGYSYSDGKVTVGWLSASAVWMGSKEEKGTSYTVTDKMRRWFFAHNVPIGKNTVIIPKRPTYDPEFAAVQPLIAPYIDQKIAEYLVKGPPGKGTNKRKYRVYG